MAFFDNSGANEYQEAIEKALQAGYGSDSSAFTGGRALIPEDCEQETLNILSETKDDCKVMASLKTEKVKSTVHEKNLRENEGEFKHLTTTEGGESAETDQDINRKLFEMKYIQTKRGITRQMVEVETFEGAYASEKISGINTLVKAAEYLCFHGDSRVVPTEFDGFETQIHKADAAHQNVIDLEGASIGSYGEKLFDEIALKVFRNGGSLEKAYFPPVLARDIKELFEDKIRFDVMKDTRYSFKNLLDYPTATGETIRLSGGDAGADKFFYAKGAVEAEGDAAKRPVAPASVAAAAAANAGSKFAAVDAGNYMYTVHAINAAGISAGTSLPAAAAVAAGDGVTLTITHGAGIRATGFIICRSKKGGTETMEMCRIPAGSGATTTFVDKNEERPGTVSMVFLTENKIQPVVKFGQLMAVSTIPLGRRTAKDEFLVATFGGLMLFAPKFCGLVKNISYKGGF